MTKTTQCGVRGCDGTLKLLHTITQEDGQKSRYYQCTHDLMHVWHKGTTNQFLRAYIHKGEDGTDPLAYGSELWKLREAGLFK